MNPCIHIISPSDVLTSGKALLQLFCFHKQPSQLCVGCRQVLLYAFNIYCPSVVLDQNYIDHFHINEINFLDA